MSLIIATGSNIGDSIQMLKKAKASLSSNFKLKAESQIYSSAAVDYTNQPDFFNQVLEFELPEISPEEVHKITLEIENNLGRVKLIHKGPRNIDIDLIFWGLDNIDQESLVIPHPSWSKRSFVVRPLAELPFFQTVKKCFKIPNEFTIEATPI